ncbi:MAG: MFS transporter, partial [Anaerolineae bacterium]|nr:MFS transporter [Anaerolineae bacterium]
DVYKRQGKLTARFAESRLIFGASVLMGVSLLAWAFVPNLVALLIVLAPMALAGGTLNTVLNSALTKAVTRDEIGGTLGLAASVESVTRVIAPTLGGFLIEFLGTSAPGIFSAIVMAWVVVFVWRRIVVNPDPPLAPRGVSV